VLIAATFQFILSALAIVVAGIFLARSSDTIAELTNLGRLLVGCILLAGATSLPELLVDISAIQKGMPDLAVGDLMGSSLMNLLILGIADLLHRNPNKIFSRAGSQHVLLAALSITLTTLAAAAIFLGPYATNAHIADIGVGPLVIGTVYILGVRLVYFDQQISVRKPSSPSDWGTNKLSLIKAISIYLLCAFAIFIAAPFLADAAGSIADLTGVSRTFIGSTLVAFCTSLPEVASTIAAVRMGAFGLAVGNIFGSNSFNMIILIPLDWFHPGNLLGAVSRSHILTALAVVLATSVAMMGQLYLKDERKTLIEPDAVAVIGIVLGAIFILYSISGT
jgi:cation:H+ antiporter